MTQAETLTAQLVAALRGGEGAPDPQAAPGLADALLDRLVQALMLEGPAGGPRTAAVQAAAQALRQGLPARDLPSPQEEAHALAWALIRALDFAADVHTLAQLAAGLRRDPAQAEVLERLCARGDSAVDELARPGEDPRDLELLLLRLSVDGLVHSALRKGNIWRYDPTPAGRLVLELLRPAARPGVGEG